MRRSVLLRGNRNGSRLFFPATVAPCLAAIIAAYFLNNPLRHGGWFMLRRFINWFPLGMTYAFLCMGRYNIIVAKGALGALMAKEDLGIAYIGSSLQSFSLGFIITLGGWHWWPVYIIPFAVIGLLLALKIWYACRRQPRSSSRKRKA